MILIERKIKRKDIIEKPNDLFKALFNYINEFDNTWITRIVPATDDKIEEFRKASEIVKNGYDYPESYVTFLKLMGENDGGLLSEPFLGTANIDELIDYYIRYKDILYTELEMKPNQLLFF